MEYVTKVGAPTHLALQLATHTHCPLSTFNAWRATTAALAVADDDGRLLEDGR